MLGDIIIFMIVILCEVFITFGLVFNLWLIVAGDCYIGYIDAIEYGGRSRGYIHRLQMYVKTWVNQQEVVCQTMEGFQSLFAYQGKLNRLRKKYIGKQVHVYINSKFNKRFALTREHCWRVFLPLILGFLLFLIPIGGIIGNFIGIILSNIGAI